MRTMKTLKRKQVKRISAQKVTPLNPPDSFHTGLVRWRISSTDHKVDAEVGIYDCSRSVQLDFFASSPKELTASLRKLDTFISELQTFKERLLSCKEIVASKPKGNPVKNLKLALDNVTWKK